MIVIVNYGSGNLLSVQNMLNRVGCSSKISSEPKDILAATKIILPGVGHFDSAMKMLNQSGLRQALDHVVLEKKRLVLGICLGAQILGKNSEEGKESGLGWIDMRCRRFPNKPGLRVPHMGWNRIFKRCSTPLFANTGDDARFYFVHSYYMECANDANIIGTSFYESEFTCVVKHGNIYGTQFHPEKSLNHGLNMMRAFAELERK